VLIKQIEINLSKLRWKFVVKLLLNQTIMKRFGQNILSAGSKDKIVSDYLLPTSTVM